MSEEEGYINITNDGGLKKKIIKKGHGEKPNEGSIDCFSFFEKKLNQKNNNVLTIKELNIGKKWEIKGLKICIKTMKVGEKSIFILSSEYSNIRSRGYKIYEIELKNFKYPAKKIIYSQRTYNRGLSEIKSNNIYKKKININETRNIREIPHEKLNKSKYIDIKMENETKRNYKVSQSIDKQIGNNNIKKINDKYGFHSYQNLIMKTEAPICDKCFRLIYISFDFIKN